MHTSPPYSTTCLDSQSELALNGSNGCFGAILWIGFIQWLVQFNCHWAPKQSQDNQSKELITFCHMTKDFPLSTQPNSTPCLIYNLHPHFELAELALLASLGSIGYIGWMGLLAALALLADLALLAEWYSSIAAGLPTGHKLTCQKNEQPYTKRLLLFSPPPYSIILNWIGWIGSIVWIGYIGWIG